MNDSCICLINKLSASVFSGTIEGETNNTKETLTVPDAHLHKGATSGLNDPFDAFITQKLQSLWTLKQNIRGDGGQIYQLENGNLVIKTSNIFLHGLFKGLLIEINVKDHVVENYNKEYLTSLFEKIIHNYKIPTGRICLDILTDKADTYGDLCLQYSEILNF